MLVGWIDFNQNGTFESGEGTQTNVANGTNGSNVALNWPTLTGLVGGDTYMRVRFSSDIGLSIFTTGSAMSDGEVEDYPLTIQTVNFDKYVSTNATCTDTLDTLTVTVGTNVYYCYTVSNPNALAFDINAGNTSDDQGHDISGLEQTYAPGASQTVIVGPIVAGGAQLPTGVTTVNNAQIIATFSGSDITDNESASLTVTLIPPASGVKQLYFDSVSAAAPTPDLTRSPPAVDTVSNNIAGGATFTLNQGVVFQAPFTITGGSVTTVQLRMRRRGGGGARTVQAQLFNGNTATLIGTNSITWNAGGWQTLQVPINIAADTNFATGDFVRVILTNSSANNRNIQLRTLQGAIRSEVQMQSSTVINVDSIDVFSAAFPSTVRFSSYEPGSTVFIRATVSDPFGNADITGASITITDTTPTVQVNNAAMTSVDTPSGATRVYEFQYTIPATPDGFWNMSVIANEGTEGTISHTALQNLIVGTAAINISKNSATLSDPVNVSSNPKAITSSIVEYTINVENSGFGYVDTDSLVITDPLSSSTTFFFGSPFNPANIIDGTTASGLVVPLDVNDITYSNDGGATFIAPVIDGSGFDITVPPINFIRINPTGEFNGSDGTNHPSMELKFRVRVD